MTDPSARAAAPSTHDAAFDCSVIVPVYNGARVIARCLDGLAVQQVPASRFEVVVVDDGSTDGTAEVVQAWARAHPQVAARVIPQRNTGPAGARNHGAQAARGRLLLFTDADCYPSPGWVAAFLRRFDAPDAPDAAMGAYTSRQTTPAALFAQLEFAERYRKLRRSVRTDFVATYSAAYRRDVFLAMGGFEAALPKANNEDSEFSYRLSETGHRIVFVPEAVVEHEHDATWRDYFHTKVGRGFWRAVVYRRFPGKAVADSYTPQVLKAQLPLSLLVVSGILLALWRRSTRPLWLATPFLVSTLPMAIVAWQIRSPAIAWVPFGSWVRAIAFVFGVSQALLSPQHDLLVAKRESVVVDRGAP